MPDMTPITHSVFSRVDESDPWVLRCTNDNRSRIDAVVRAFSDEGHQVSVVDHPVGCPPVPGEPRAAARIETPRAARRPTRRRRREGFTE